MTAGAELHLDPGTLVRWLDDELPAAERGAVEAHLDACAACHEARASLAARSSAFGTWAAWAEPEPAVRTAGPPARSGAGAVVGAILRAPAFRAAALLVLLAGAAWAVRPITRWAGERVGPANGPADVVAPGVDTSPGSVSVAFVPEGDRLAIRLRRAPAGGSVRLTRGPGPEVEARVVGGSGGEELTVLPDGVAVVNAAASEARYEVTVPEAMREIDLYVAGRRVWSGPREALPTVWTPSAGAPAPAGKGEPR